VCWPELGGTCGCGKGHIGRDVGKAPLTPHGVDDATTDHVTIRGWWAKWPLANIAVDLKRSGLLAIDPDNEEALEDATSRGLPATQPRMSRSPAYLYERPEHCPTTNATRLGASGKLDVLANGYLVIHGMHQTGCPIYLEDFDPGPAPNWAVEILQRVARARAKPAAQFTNDPDAAAHGAALWQTIRERLPLRIVRTVEEGPDAYEPRPVSDEEAAQIRRPDASRSGADGSVVYYLITLGLSDDEVRNIYAALPIGTLGKYSERGTAYLSTTIANQRAFVERRTLTVLPGARTPATPPPGAPTPPSANGQTTVGPQPSRCTDLANSERLVARYGTDLRSCKAWGEWACWDGRRWKLDTTYYPITLGKRVARSIYQEAADAETKEERQELGAWARRSEAEARINAMVSLARDALPIEPQQFDTNPWALNVRNGTIDLRTGELRPHRREDYITKLVDLEYAPQAPCPRWLAFLERIMDGNAGLIRFLQRAMGYSATGSARERRLIITYGTGKNGKGVFLQTGRQVLGDYSLRTPSATFLARRNDAIPNDLAALRGARFVFASETNDGRRLDEATIKDLTGGEDISARFMRAEWFSFTPTFTPWLATNHRPVIRGTDPAIWDRITLVPFSVRIPDDEQDPALLETLEVEYAGILAWIVQGAAEWYAHGLGAPGEVQTATAAYRKDMDVLGAFLDEHCIADPQAWVLASRLYATYRDWCEQSGERALTQTAFGLRLDERGYPASRLGPKQARTRSGLRLNETQTGSEAQTGSDGDSPISGSVQNSRVENTKQPVSTRLFDGNPSAAADDPPGGRPYPCVVCDHLVPWDAESCPTCDAREGAE